MVRCECKQVVSWNANDWSEGMELGGQMLGYFPLLAEIEKHPDYASEPDGNDTILFLSREYCERPLNAQESEAQHTTVMNLRSLYCANSLI